MIAPRLRRGGLVAALVLTTTAPAALGDDYCVGRTGCDAGHTFPGTGDGLDSALVAADRNTTDDRVLVGPGTYARSGGGGFNQSNVNSGDLELVGAGAQETVLTRLDAGEVLFFIPRAGGVTHEVRDLGIVLPGFANVQGLVTDGPGTVIATRIRVTAAPGATGAGVQFQAGPSELRDSVVELDPGANITGVNSLAPVTLVSQSTITGLNGIVRHAPTGTLTVERSRITAGSGGAAVSTTQGAVALQSSLLVMHGSLAEGLYSGASGDDARIDADSVTLIGDGSPNQRGGEVNAGGGVTARINVTNSVIRGLAFPMTVLAAATGTAIADASWSDLDGTHNLDANGGGTDTIIQANNRDGTQDPKFLDPAAGDYRLRFDSPLIDQGNPAPASGTDLAGKPLPVDGDASGGAPRRDMGAFEYQRAAPAVTASVPATIPWKQPAAFTGTGIDPDGDALTYGWAFSDSSSSNSAGVAKTFASPGTYTGTVTVTDPTGQHASVVKTVSVIDDPPTDIAISPATVAENQPAGTTVGALGATDLTQGDTQAYALVNGAGADDNAAFTLAGGELRTAGSFDLEQKASYTVRVHVVDGAGETFEKPLTIAVGNVNEPPTGIALSAFFVPEGKPVGTAVAKLIAVDVDAGDPHTFSLVAGDGSADNSAFAVDGGVLRTATTFNAKKQPSYSIRVRTVDSGAIPLAVETQFTLTVADSTRPSGSIARMSGQTVRSVLAKGLHATLVVTEPSTAALSVLLDGATRARTSRLLARRAFSIPRKDKATVTVRLSPKAKRLLRRTRRPRLTLRVLLTDRAGNQRRIARRISLRR